MSNSRRSDGGTITFSGCSSGNESSHNISYIFRELYVSILELLPADLTKISMFLLEKGRI